MQRHSGLIPDVPSPCPDLGQTDLYQMTGREIPMIRYNTSKTDQERKRYLTHPQTRSIYSSVGILFPDKEDGGNSFPPPTRGQCPRFPVILLSWEEHRYSTKKLHMPLENHVYFRRLNKVAKLFKYGLCLHMIINLTYKQSLSQCAYQLNSLRDTTCVWRVRHLHA